MMMMVELGGAAAGRRHLLRLPGRGSCCQKVLSGRHDEQMMMRQTHSYEAELKLPPNMREARNLRKICSEVP